VIASIVEAEARRVLSLTATFPASTRRSTESNSRWAARSASWTVRGTGSVPSSVVRR
jgi:hypothetical protein